METRQLGNPSSTIGCVEYIPIDTFNRHVVESITSIDERLMSFVENVVVLVEYRHPEESDLLGLYEGVPLTERDSYGLMELPDQITIYRLPLCEMCTSVEELVEEIQITVVHEIAHHFGIDDDRLHELGWG